MVTASPDRGAVMSYSQKQWEHLVPRLWQLPKNNELARRFMRIYFGYAYRLEAGEAGGFQRRASRFRCGLRRLPGLNDLPPPPECPPQQRARAARPA